MHINPAICIYIYKCKYTYIHTFMHSLLTFIDICIVSYNFIHTYTYLSFRLFAHYSKRFMHAWSLVTRFYFDFVILCNNNVSQFCQFSGFQFCLFVFVVFFLLLLGAGSRFFVTLFSSIISFVLMPVFVRSSRCLFYLLIQQQLSQYDVTCSLEFQINASL